ncbi:NADH-quinone oxidoreductase subunit NuoG [soil metagenome]
MPTIEIDGKEIEAAAGSMIIQVADEAGIYIPRFCYHQKLSIAANCRMCLVEVEKSAKPLPACATPIMEGMKISTVTPKAKEAQKAVMEFLLINHPLDCPVCDQGGECELQDLTMGYGRDRSLFSEPKRAVADDNLGSLIASDMTRCIQCTRCVRFGQEVAGIRELGATGRGEDMEITTYIQTSLKSEISGNIIDLCPVGALTSKPFRFRARAWELVQHPSIAAHDCLGSHIYVHTRRGIVMRVVPRDEESINETWLSDRDRFSYLGLSSPDRLQAPMIRRAGKWEEVDWATAINFVAENLRRILTQYGPQHLAAIVAPTATIEELYLLQKLIRALGCNNIDHRLRQTDFADQELFPLYPGSPIAITEIEKQNVILLIGSDIQKEQPLAGVRVRKAELNGTQVAMINTTDCECNFTLSDKKIVSPWMLTTFLAAVAKVVCSSVHLKVPVSIQAQFAEIKPETAAKNLAKRLLSGENKLIILGAAAFSHPQAAVIRGFVHLIAEASGAKVAYLTDGPNTAGAWIAGAIPHRVEAGGIVAEAGLDSRQIFDESMKAYLLYEVDPLLDCVNPSRVARSLADAEFVLALSAFKSERMMHYANVILPIAPFTETAGTFVNVEGRWQSFKQVATLLGEARPGWKILRVLANQLNLPDFDYIDSTQIRDEIYQKLLSSVECEQGGSQYTEISADIPESSLRAQRSNPEESSLSLDCAVKPAMTSGREFIKDKLSFPSVLHTENIWLDLMQRALSGDFSPQKIDNRNPSRITEWPMYAVDGLVRRAQALQESVANQPVALRTNNEMAQQLHITNGVMATVTQGRGKAILPVIVDEGIPNHCVWVPAGYPETAELGEPFGEIEVK